MQLSMLKKTAAAAAMTIATLGMAVPATADRPDDGMILTYHQTFEGRTVAFVPVTMGWDLTQGWMAAVQRDADRLGYELTIRDSNYSVDAGAQAISQLINEEPDIIIIQNADTQAYLRLIQRAMAAGINVIQMNMKTPINSDAFIGGDWYGVGVDAAHEAARLCGEGTSGQIALIQGPVTAPPNVLGVAGVQDALEEYPNVELVAIQAADWDASRAHAISSTIIRQHEDLCAFIGLWDNMDVGIAAAIREAGRQDQISLISTGGGNRDLGCANVENGAFTSYVMVNTRDQARQLASMIQVLLQMNPEPGAQPFAIYTENQILTPETVAPTSCWSVDQIRAGN